MGWVGFKNKGSMGWGSLILTFWCFLTHLCITYRVHTSLWGAQVGLVVASETWWSNDEKMTFLNCVMLGVRYYDRRANINVTSCKTWFIECSNLGIGEWREHLFQEDRIWMWISLSHCECTYHGNSNACWNGVIMEQFVWTQPYGLITWNSTCLPWLCLMNWEMVCLLLGISLPNKNVITNIIFQNCVSLNCH
jgi:hypothetical protein